MRRLLLHGVTLLGVGVTCGLLGYWIGRGLRTIPALDWTVAGAFDLGTVAGLFLVVSYLTHHERAVDALDGWWTHRRES